MQVSLSRLIFNLLCHTFSCWGCTLVTKWTSWSRTWGRLRDRARRRSEKGAWNHRKAGKEVGLTLQNGAESCPYLIPADTSPSRTHSHGLFMKVHERIWAEGSLTEVKAATRAWRRSVSRVSSWWLTALSSLNMSSVGNLVPFCLIEYNLPLLGWGFSCMEERSIVKEGRLNCVRG